MAHPNARRLVLQVRRMGEPHEHERVADASVVLDAGGRLLGESVEVTPVAIIRLDSRWAPGRNSKSGAKAATCL